MHLLIYFFRKYRYFLFFIFLEIIAFVLILNNHSFHTSKFVSSANYFSGGIYERVSNWNDYFNLRDENDRLIDENFKLLKKLEHYKTLSDSVFQQSISDSIYNENYTIKNGRIINNKYNSQYNYLTIDLGKKDSILPEMGVYNSKGIIGITDASSANYSRVVSILNRDSKINARPKNSSYFGTLIWDGEDYNTVQLIDVPRQANLTIGDTIITGGKSSIFPEGIHIGTVKEIKNQTNSTKIINVLLFNDMSNLRNVYVISNLEKNEIRNLENTNNE